MKAFQALDLLVGRPPPFVGLPDDYGAGPAVFGLGPGRQPAFLADRGQDGRPHLAHGRRRQQVTKKEEPMVPQLAPEAGRVAEQVARLEGVERPCHGTP